MRTLQQALLSRLTCRLIQTSSVLPDQAYSPSQVSWNIFDGDHVDLVAFDDSTDI